MSIQYLTRKCTHCGEGLYFWNVKENEGSPYMIACYGCGRIAYRGDDIHKVNQWVMSGTLPVNKKEFTMMEAYEANKNSTACVACGSKTVPNYNLTPFIQYCKCVEYLPKERHST